jgi:riboflavin kinase/FMN adenylyltransferase
MHSGHRAVIGELCRRADEHGLVPGVVTFDPHPLAVVAPDRAPAMLTDIEQRIELLEGLGVELVGVVAFDAATRNWSATEFAVGLLADTLAARLVLAGEDFRFGRDRSGDVAALRRLGEAHGFNVVIVPLVGGGRASSRSLRALIAAGEVEAVAVELERPHEVRGVAHRRGEALIAEIPAGMAMPPPGVYATGQGASEICRQRCARRRCAGVVLGADPDSCGAPEFARHPDGTRRVGRCGTHAPAHQGPRPGLTAGSLITRTPGREPRPESCWWGSCPGPDRPRPGDEPDPTPRLPEVPA